MVDSRAKGARAEGAVKKVLRDYTGMDWQRVPASGALSAVHGLKGDLYIAKKDNAYCVEVKHYKDDQLTSKILTGKDPILFQWWDQALRQGQQIGAEPLLIFKFDRSKMFVATYDEPLSLHVEYVFLSERSIYIMLLQDWLDNEEILWVKK